MTRRSVFIFLAVILMTAVGCNTNGCLNNQSAIPLAELYSSATGAAISLNNLQISGVGAPNDSVLISSGTAVSKLYLPMRSSQSSTAWCFHYTQEGLDDPALNDTIEFVYTSMPYFASEECGAMYYYHIVQVKATDHLMDSVVIVDSLITNVDLTRIKIYFRTVEPDTPENPDEPEQGEETGR